MLLAVVGAIFVIGCADRATVTTDDHGRPVVTLETDSPSRAGTGGGAMTKSPSPLESSPVPQIIRTPWPRTITGERMAACYDEMLDAIEAGRWLDANLLAIRFSRLCGRAADEGATTDERTDERRAADEVERRANAALAEMDGHR